MTNLELILLVILWIISYIYLIHKYLQLDNTSLKELWEIDSTLLLLLLFLTLILNPILWIGAITYFTFIKSWKED